MSNPNVYQFWALVETKESLENDQTAFGITFPGLAGVFGAADNENEIASSAIDALQTHFDNRDEGEPFPVVLTLKQLLADEAVRLALSEGQLLIPVPYIGDGAMDNIGEMLSSLLGAGGTVEVINLNDLDDDDDDEEQGMVLIEGEAVVADPTAFSTTMQKLDTLTPGETFQTESGEKFQFIGTLEYAVIVYRNPDLGITRMAVVGHPDLCMDGNDPDQVAAELMEKIMKVGSDHARSNADQNVLDVSSYPKQYELPDQHSPEGAILVNAYVEDGFYATGATSFVLKATVPVSETKH